MDATLYGRIAAGAALGPLRRRPDALPERELTRAGVRVERDRLAAYDRVCGYPLGDVLPATYPHVLAFPLAMELMAAGDFPFGVLGLVHVANEIEQLRPLRADEALDLRVWAAGLRDHARGRQFDVLAEASVDGETAWRDRSTYLHREGGGSSNGARERSEPPEASAVWDAPGDTGRRYAAVSGDVNPIHMHGLSARLFGQKGAIAHGMWSKARCLAALQGHVPGAFTVDAAFKLPIRLPAKVAFASWREDGGRAFALHDARGGKPHLSGSLRPSASAT